jgi:DNA-binding ferritin-like protein
MSALKEAIKFDLKSARYSNSQDDSKLIGYFVKRTFAITTQLHVYHLLTKNYNVHEIIGDLYESIQSNVDGLAEGYLAIGGECEGTFESVTFYEYDFGQLMELIFDYKDSIEESIESLESAEEEAIKAKLINIQEAVHKAIYLLQMA